MRLDVVSLAPEAFAPLQGLGVIGRAFAAGRAELHVHNPRDYALDRYRKVDDEPYGGGAGMVMRADVLVAAAESVWNDVPPGTQVAPPQHVAGGPRPRTVLLTPRGRPLTQALVRELAEEERLVLLCGRYEGIDERVHDLVATDEVSVGDYVLMGGEVAAAAIVEAVVRLLPGVLGNAESAVLESFEQGLLEHPHYTRPVELRGHTVPEVLRSGDHGAIAAWRREQAIARTREVRPDLLERPGGPDGAPG